MSTCTAGAGRLKIVGTTPGLSLLRFSMPNVEAMAVSGSKQSTVKWTLHSTEVLVGFHIFLFYLLG